MNQSRGGPPTGGPQGSAQLRTQDARGSQGNLAFHPAAALPKVNLKKTAVKVVRRAAPEPLQSSPQRVSSPTVVATPVKAEPMSPDGPANVVPPAVPAFSFSLPSGDVAPKDANTDAGGVEDLATMFARLTSGQSAVEPELFVIKLPSSQSATTPQSPVVNAPPSPVPEAAEGPEFEIYEDDNPELFYMRKAAEYIDALPASDGATPVTLIQNVTAELRKIETPIELKASSLSEDSKYRRYARAVADFINNAKGPTDFLHLVAHLVDEKVINLNTLKDVDDLCHAIVDHVLSETPKTPSTVAASLTVVDAAATPQPTTATPIWKDPMVGAKAWPNQEKRENMPGCRTILLKGTLIMNTVHKIQALVWGGRLESITLDPAKGFALVKFMSPEACQKYYDATANGIELEFEGKKLAFLPERPSGPNSVNDVLQNAIDAGASRCVRVLDADEDWTDAALNVLAGAKGKNQREVDCVKRGNDRGRFYIEFRFATVYAALSMKRALLDDIDWEHCSIQYAPDPCEVASGVHLDD